MFTRPIAEADPNNPNSDTSNTVDKAAEEYRKLNIILMCKFCRNPTPNIIENYKDGDLVCGDCGLVLGDRIIDTRSEWRTFANDDGDDPSRVGAAANPLLEGSQLDTAVSAMGHTNAAAKELTRIMNRTNNSKSDRRNLNVYKDIAAMCEAGGLSKNIAERAKNMFKKASDHPKINTKKVDVAMAGCIFMACRNEGVPRTFKEISALTHVSLADIGRSYKLLVKHLGGDQKTTTSSDELMPRFCSHLGLSMEIQNACTVLAREAIKVDSLAGRSPVSIAAAAIYFITHLYKQGKSATDIALVAGVSASTIKSAYKVLYEEKSSILDLSKLNKNLTFASLP